jgi:hypothetical protein
MLMVRSTDKVDYLFTTVKSYDKRTDFAIYECDVTIPGLTRKEVYVVDDESLKVCRRPDLEDVEGVELVKFLEGRAKWHKDQLSDSSRTKLKELMNLSA